MHVHVMLYHTLLLNTLKYYVPYALPLRGAHTVTTLAHGHARSHDAPPRTQQKHTHKHRRRVCM